MTKKELREYKLLRAEVEQLARVPRQNLVGPVAWGIYADKKAKCEARLIAIENAIDALPVVERVALRAYYVQGMTWERVADLLHYDVRQVHRIHGRALQRLAAEKEAQ